MKMSNSGIQNQKVRVVIALISTLASIHWIPNPLAVLGASSLIWIAAFYPWRQSEIVLFGVASVFFLIQDYICLKAGIFEFKIKDILLMPFYEPFLWGFYFLSLKRFVSGTQETSGVLLGKRNLFALAATCLAFSISPERTLLPITMLSTAFLFTMFHTAIDFYYATCSLILGFVIECFGVWFGLWSYPVADFWGIPFWFATLWISVGVLNYRFLIPVSERLGKPRSQGA
jgi:hypothetical protein